MKIRQISKTLIYSVVAVIMAILAGVLGIVAIGNNQSIIRDLPSNQITDSQNNPQGRVVQAQFITQTKTVPISLEIADTSETQARGLMFRTSMPDNFGMLFVFENEQIRTFWMQNTFISLDILYLDENFEVVDIFTNTKTNQTLETYTSRALARYVVELNAGKSAKEGIKIGDRLEVSL